MVEWEYLKGLISRAEYLLISAGAGMSCDAGLPAYRHTVCENSKNGLRDRDGQNYNSPVLQQVSPLLKTHSYDELADGVNMASSHMKDKCLGFWLSCAFAYKNADPHAGYYAIAAELGRRAAQGARIYTSNVDGMFLRVLEEHWQGTQRKAPADLLASDIVHEIHGNCLDWQCPQCGSTTTLQAGRSASNSKFTSEFHGETCASLAPTDSSVVNDLRKVLADDGALRLELAKRSPFLYCSNCSIMRWPRVVLFNDPRPHEFVIPPKVSESYQQWEELVEHFIAKRKEDMPSTLTSVKHKEPSLVILELGCGVHIPTVRHEMEWVFNDCNKIDDGSAVLIRVNPEHGQFPTPDRFDTTAQVGGSLLNIRRWYHHVNCTCAPALQSLCSTPDDSRVADPKAR